MISIGTDVEEFVLKDGGIITAYRLVGGSKEQPLTHQWGNMQEDNVLAEYATIPAYDLPSFKLYISLCREAINNKLGVSGAQLEPIASHTFTIDYLKQCGTHAITMGCDAEYNAWEGGIIPPPFPFQPLRTAGGHVHIGYGDITEDKSRAIVRVLDYLLGVWSVGADPDIKRRAMYGKAGSHRIKPYGVEYRALSNFWVMSEDTIEYVYRACEWASNNIHYLPSLLSLADGEEVQRIINTYDKDAAFKLTNEVRELCQQ